jgi:alkanesulfonate monooxygenase SsuD/methylene tetrahydromethanopterin reductase-like flavin-dependent oxidoreductase (luciferase family)
MPSARRLAFRFGFALPTNGPFSQPETIVDFAEHAERLRFDDIWANDFLDFDRSRVSRSTAGTFEAAKHQDPNFFEGLTTISFLAGRLRRIGIGMHGIQLPLRDPRLFAKQVATIHELSGRRLTIAPAIGGPEKDFAIMQVPFRLRGRLMDEHMAAIHAIFFQEHPVSFAGERVKFSDATLYPRPIGLRLWVTGETEPAWHRVVRWGTGWFTSYPPVDEYVPKLARLRELATAAGRDPDEIDTAATVFLCVESTRERALAVASRSLVERWGSVEQGLGKAIVGDVAEVQEQLAARHAAGLRYLELKFFAHTPESFMEMMARTAEEVLPPLRRL